MYTSYLQDNIHSESWRSGYSIIEAAILVIQSCTYNTNKKALSFGFLFFNKH